MKKIFFIIIFLIFYSCSFGQEQRIPILYQSFVNQDSTNLYIYTSFSIPYNTLVFVKDGNTYKSSFTWTTELKNDKSKIIREVEKYELSTDNYALTVSADSFYKGFLRINCDSSNYKISNLIEFGNTNFSYLFGETNLNMKDKLDSLLRVPIVTEFINNNYYLAERGNMLPLSKSNFAILLPNNDLSTDSLKLEIIQNNKVKQLSAKKFGYNNFVYSTKNSKVGLNFFKDSSLKSIYIIDVLEESIDEGELVISYTHNNNNYKNKLSVVWFNKPKSLSSNEIALAVMYTFFDKEIVDKISDLDDKDIYEGIKSFWNKNFPSKEQINGKMNEFFLRVDYTIDKFTVSNKLNGYKTDRGKVFIKYGEPDSINREYAERDNIIEIWYYKNINKTFIFKDISGIGNFTIVN